MQVGVQAGLHRRRADRRPYYRKSQEPNSCYRWRVGDDVVVQECLLVIYTARTVAEASLTSYVHVRAVGLPHRRIHGQTSKVRLKHPAADPMCGRPPFGRLRPCRVSLHAPRFCGRRRHWIFWRAHWRWRRSGGY